MEFSLEFSKILIEAAEPLSNSTISTGQEAQRAVLYLSLLSCEISLKALLESAGLAVKDIRKRSHDLAGLLQDVGTCKLSATHPNGRPRTGVDLRAKEVDPNTPNDTVGSLLEAEDQGASKYPSEIRYGNLIHHFPPPTMLKCAKAVHAWANSNIQGIKHVP